MKDEYDFSHAEQGKFYIPIEEIQIPIYLDQDIQQYLNQIGGFNQDKLRVLVNDILRKNLELLDKIN
jgi:hypothetical protein